MAGAPGTDVLEKSMKDGTVEAGTVKGGTRDTRQHLDEPALKEAKRTRGKETNMQEAAKSVRDVTTPLTRDD